MIMFAFTPKPDTREHSDSTTALEQQLNPRQSATVQAKDVQETFKRRSDRHLRDIVNLHGKYSLVR